MRQTSDVVDAIEGSDIPWLLRLIEGMCKAGEWDDLLDLAARCRRAVERGKQLWGVAYHADYRLALEAPGQYAGPVAAAGGGGITIGPLTEVAASSHSFDELAPHLPPGTTRALIAHERILRGEDLNGDDTIDVQVLELPLTLADWERKAVPASFLADQGQFPTLDLPVMAAVELTRGAPVLDHTEETDALLGLVKPWVTESNGRVDVVAVEGGAEEAIAALGPSRVRLVEVDLETAYAWMLWAASSGGAHGKRPGGAAGRFATWWAIAALADIDWPSDADELGNVGRTLQWYLWDDMAPATGWVLRLAAADPEHSVAWAISAIDGD